MISTIYPLMESFYTIQGEGYHQGRAAYFVRLGGCDVGCHWCDVKESWEADRFPKISTSEITKKAKEFSSDIVVVTGGEPLMYDLKDLTEVMHQQNLKTHIETSGAYPLSGTWDWICVSPKKFKKPLDSVLQYADELKMIVYNQSDFEWAEEYAEKVHENCKLYLQPEWSKREQMTPLIVEYVKNNPQWEVSLQIHKYLNIP